MNDRVSTGSDEADRILSGGFLRNSINLVMGQPGTGKTVLAEQLLFRNADSARPSLYLTTLSEPLPKVVTYLQHFDFFDASKLGTAVLYDDIGPALAKKGIGALVTAVEEAIRTLSPKILVIDSFKALHDLAPSTRDMRTMLHELTGMLTAYEATTLLLGEYTDEEARRLPEFAIADGIVQLLRNPSSTLDERYFRVLKLRGSPYVEGQHSFRITSKGLEVYPRLVSPEAPVSYTATLDRASTGVPGLDPLMGGGLRRGSTTILAGPTGSGKTTIGLQFVLEGIRRGEPCLFVNFQENPSQLALALDTLGMPIDDARRRGLSFFYASPVEIQIDSVIVSIFETIRKQGIRRVVIDAVGDLIMAAGDARRVHYFLYALIQHFAVLGVTCMLTHELPRSGDALAASEGGERLSYLSDNIVQLDVKAGEHPRRTLAVLKARGMGHDLGAHVLHLGAGGASVTA